MLLAVVTATGATGSLMLPAEGLPINMAGDSMCGAVASATLLAGIKMAGGAMNSIAGGTAPGAG